jgi:hypothetical protein
LRWPTRGSVTLWRAFAGQAAVTRLFTPSSLPVAGLAGPGNGKLVARQTHNLKVAATTIKARQVDSLAGFLTLSSRARHTLREAHGKRAEAARTYLHHARCFTPCDAVCYLARGRTWLLASWLSVHRIGVYRRSRAPRMLGLRCLFHRHLRLSLKCKGPKLLA